MLHPRKLIGYIIFFLNIICSLSYAKTRPLTYKEVDSLTYKLFMDGDFEEVQNIIDRAIAQDIDFYDMRLRAGIVYYDKREYDGALSHFQKAYKMNPADTVIQEYLYYTYLLSGRSEDAREFATNQASTFQDKVGHEDAKLMDYIGLSSSLGISSNMSINSQSNLKGPPNIHGEATFYKSIYLNTLYVQNTFYNRLHIINGFSMLNAQNQQTIQVTDQEKTVSLNDTHYQYNISGFYQFNHGWGIGAGYATYNTNVSSISYGLKNGIETFLDPTTTSSSESAQILTLSKRFPYVQFVVSKYLSNLQSDTHNQTESQMILFPNGNLELYFLSSVAHINNKMARTDQWVVMEKIGKKLSDTVYGDISISYGNHTNYITSGGFITYNTGAKILLMCGANLDFYFNKVVLSLGYSLDKREFQSIQYQDETNYTLTTQTFFNNFIKTNIKWNF